MPRLDKVGQLFRFDALPQELLFVNGVSAGVTLEVRRARATDLTHTSVVPTRLLKDGSATAANDTIEGKVPPGSIMEINNRQYQVLERDTPDGSNYDGMTFQGQTIRTASNWTARLIDRFETGYYVIGTTFGDTAQALDTCAAADGFTGTEYKALANGSHLDEIPNTTIEVEAATINNPGGWLDEPGLEQVLVNGWFQTPWGEGTDTVNVIQISRPPWDLGNIRARAETILDIDIPKGVELLYLNQPLAQDPADGTEIKIISPALVAQSGEGIQTIWYEIETHDVTETVQGEGSQSTVAQVYTATFIVRDVPSQLTDTFDYFVDQRHGLWNIQGIEHVDKLHQRLVCERLT